MGIKVHGTQATINRLRRGKKRITKEVKEEVIEGAERIKDLSVALSPYLTGALESAHDIEVYDYGDDGIEVDVYVDPNYPAGVGGPDKRVGDYLDFIHDGHYNPGPGTRSKPTVEGMRPYRQFMTRAAEYLEKDITRRVNNAARRAARRS